MIVLDASAAVDLLLDVGEPADWVRERLQGVEELHAPHLLDIEVGSALRRHLLLGAVDGDGGACALDSLGAPPIVRDPHGPLAHRMWALRRRLAYHDAVYVAPAEALGGLLVTTDGRLGRAGLGSRVAAFPDHP